jgi:hypothetical protein
MLKYFWNSPSAEERAKAELQACFYALTAQKEVVAEKRKAYDLIRVVTEEAKKAMESSHFLYDSAVQVLGENSKEAGDLNINHRIRQSKYELQWNRLADARTALDASIVEKDKLQAKYNALQGIQEPAPIPAPEQSRLPGKLVLPQTVVEHFKGNNREHVSSKQALDLQKELADTRPGVSFSKMHKKLAETLHLEPSVPNTPPSSERSSGSFSLTLNPLFMGPHPAVLPFRQALEDKLKRMQPPVQTLDEELKAAITARRAQFNN